MALKRVVTQELLDTDAGTAEEVAASLADLRWFNRYFGGLSTTAALLSRVTKKLGSGRLTYLDVAGASGDGGCAARKQLNRHGVELELTVVDRTVSHLRHRMAAEEPIVVAADAFSLPFADRSFDVAGSSLFLHHLEPDEIIAVVNESLRVSCAAIVINDLYRTYVHWLAAWAGVPLYRSRITRYDAPASVRRAYTMDEMRSILKKTNAREIEASRHFFYRMGFILWQ